MQAISPWTQNSKRSNRTCDFRLVHRANPFLVGIPPESTASLDIEPSANYAVKIDTTVENHSSWIEFGGINSSALCSNAVRCQLKLHFNASGFADGTELSDNLLLTGIAQGLPAAPASIRISVQVTSSPSFDLSTIVIPNAVTMGETVSISIVAVDTEGLAITKARGRSINLQFEKDGVITELPHNISSGHEGFLRQHSQF